MANADAAILGVLGSGRRARTQVEAVCKVRDIRESDRDAVLPNLAG